MAKGGPGKANQANRTKRSVGAYGSKRGTPDIQNAKQRRRAQSPRWRNAQEETQAQRARVEAMLADPSQHVSQTGNAVLTQQQALEASYPDLCVCGCPEHKHRNRSFVLIKCQGCSCKKFERYRFHIVPEPEPENEPLPPFREPAKRVNKPKKITPPKPDLDPNSEGDAVPLWYARSQMRQGYHINAVCRRTGWGINYLKDLADPDGWGLTEEGDNE